MKNAFSEVALGLTALLTVSGCGGATTQSATVHARASNAPTATAQTAAAPQAAPTNTSIATARALAAGESLQSALPCDGSAVYFGPFRFDHEGQTVRIASQYHTASTQICGGGAWVSASGEFSAVAGLGCVEDGATAQMENENTFTPASGGSDVNPVYLKLQVADPRPAGCVESTFTLHRTQ